MLEKRVSISGMTEDEQTEMLRPAHSFQEIQSSNNWIPEIALPSYKQRPHQTIPRQKKISAAAAWIEPVQITGFPSRVSNYSGGLVWF